jgi:shikimate kinase
VEVLRAALTSDAVVATGGGVVSRDEARALLRGEPTIWLDCADELVVARVSGGDRPLLGEDPRAALGALRARREAWYREVSRERVDTASELGEVVDAVIEASGRVAPCG